MAELELTRAKDDRRLYALGSVGTLRLGGVFSRSATAEAGGRRWTFTRRSILRSTFEVTDGAGTVVGSFEGRSLRRGGVLRWGDRTYALRPASAWRERYALAVEERELAVFDGKGWGRRPVAVSVDDPASIEAGLLLFAAFVVRRLADDASAGASAGSSAAAAG